MVAIKSLLAISAVVAVSALQLKPVEVKPYGTTEVTTEQGNVITITALNDDGSKKLWDPKPQADFQFCGMCVQLMMGAINYLLNYILNAGVVSSCSELCDTALKGHPLEADACIALCDGAGLATFIEALEKVGPDPIAACEEIDLCQYVKGGKVKIDSYTATPQQAKLGDTVVLLSQFTVINTTSTGEIRFQFTGPGGGHDADGVALSTPPGNYEADCKLPTGGQKSAIPAPGNFNTTFFFCEGQCGSHWHDAHVYAQASTHFTVAGN